MHLSLITLSLLANLVLAQGPLVDIQKASGQVKPDSYIVTLKSGTSKVQHLQDLSSKFGANVTVSHSDWDPQLFNGAVVYSAKFDNSSIQKLRADPTVASIEMDGLYSVSGPISKGIVTQNNAPWGLQRISQTSRLVNNNANNLNFLYRYDSSAGRGVDIYIVDTGIFISHTDFGNRAKWGATFGGYPNQDGNGHGTHVAGTAAGTRFGVAKSANLIAVKVLSDSGSGFLSDVISGLNFVRMSAGLSGRPSIASMSLGGGVSSALDSAVAGLTSYGVHVTVAAGNANQDARNTSPARAPSAITVGATDISDHFASFSNYGPAVDVSAPGVNVVSDWIASSTAQATLSGTSMACPHVAGLVAYFISLQGNISPAAMSSKIQSFSTKGAILGLPAGTVNLLARNNVQ